MTEGLRPNVLKAVEEAGGPEMVAKIRELAQGKSPQPAFQLPLREIFVVLAAAAMMVGKDPIEVDEVNVALTAKRTADRIFQP